MNELNNRLEKLNACSKAMACINILNQTTV